MENRISQPENRPGAIKSWIEAMRLRTLPVSIAGVLAGTASAILTDSFKWLPAILCLLFALLAQIASNFANEYFDFKYGLDKKGREGFRRGVTEGDISPRAMLRGIVLTLILAMTCGCGLLFFGNPAILIPVGILVGVFALAYSTGPYPLSHHGLGDIAVIIFFGIVPVSLTDYVQTSDLRAAMQTLPLALAIGLMAANVLMVNNYRDIEDDKAVGKRTTAVIFGRRNITIIYLLSGIIASFLAIFHLLEATSGLIILPAGTYLLIHILIWRAMTRRSGSLLNPLLGMTACNLCLFTLLLLAVVIA